MWASRLLLHMHVASDVCSRELDAVFRSIFPNYVGCSLDPMHLSFAVDSHTKCDSVRPTVVGLIMRPRSFIIL